MLSVTMLSVSLLKGADSLQVLSTPRLHSAALGGSSNQHPKSKALFANKSTELVLGLGLWRPNPAMY